MGASLWERTPRPETGDYLTVNSINNCTNRAAAIIGTAFFCAIGLSRMRFRQKNH
jgi:hypothetical protein